MTDETTVEAAEPEAVIEPPYEGSTGLAVDELPRTGEFAEEEQEVEQESEKEDAKPTGYDQVDFQKDSREEIEARFHRLYGQMKQSQSMVDQMAVDQRALYEKMQNWEVAQAQTNTQSQMSQLQAQLQEAMDVGDAARSTAIIGQISQLSARAAIPQPTYTPQVQQEAPQDSPDVAKIREWSSSRDWTQEGHKDRPWAALQLNDMYQSPEWSGQSVEAKLAEVERRYTELRQPPEQTVAPVLDQGGGQRRRPGAKMANLNQDQKNIAVRMFPEKEPKAAYEAYTRGLG